MCPEIDVSCSLAHAVSFPGSVSSETWMDLITCKYSTLYVIVRCDWR